MSSQSVVQIERFIGVIGALASKNKSKVAIREDIPGKREAKVI